VIIGTIAGLITGVITSLVPGLHTGLALALLLAIGVQSIFGNEFAIFFIASAAGVSLYTRRLANVYHPSAGSGDIASLDPALALTSQGRGPDALRIMIMGTDSAWTFITICAVVILFMTIGKSNVLMSLNKPFGIVGLFVIAVWIVITAARSKKPALTLFGFTLIGLLGCTILFHPALKGNEHSMAPLMSGLFGIPIMLAVLAERNKNPLPPQIGSDEIILDPKMPILGTCIGGATGFLAGLGAGSLATLAVGEETSREDFLLLSSAAESANDIMALLLVLVAGMGRSGEAVLLGRVAGQTSITQALIVLALVALCAYIGRHLTIKLETIYGTIIQWFPSSFWALLVIGLALFQVMLTGNLIIGLTLTFAGVCISLWARSCKLPLQVSFAGIAIPVLITNTGFAPAFNSMIFGL
jgi:putative membrane protein